jgi:hypothetical protein
MNGLGNREALEYNGAGAIQNWYSFAQGPDAVLNLMNIAGGTRARAPGFTVTLASMPICVATEKSPERGTKQRQGNPGCFSGD